ncbi:MAG: hypothetical protein IT318_12080 [Anaerolineales bacterium]|nr:hypothetical protein [Anaerolineales bacterium]
MSKRRAIPLLGFSAAAVAGLAYVGWVRPWMLRWGATRSEARRSLPGDHLVPAPRTSFTRAISLRASPEQVWPWLAQIGCHRAGWYSYDQLDNGGHPSAACLVPELQNLGVGDEIWAAPDGTLAFSVYALDPGRSLVLSGPLDRTTPFTPGRTAFGATAALDPVRASWAFVLVEAETPGLTRLLVRFRADYPPNPLSSLAGALLEPVSFLMERKMLLGIKARVERQPPHDRCAQ